MKRLLQLSAVALVSLLVIPMAQAGMASSSLIGEIFTTNPTDVVSNLDTDVRIYQGSTLIAQLDDFDVEVVNGSRPGTYIVRYTLTDLDPAWVIGPYSIEWSVNAKDVTDPVSIVRFTYADANGITYEGDYPPRPFTVGAIAWIN